MIFKMIEPYGTRIKVDPRIQELTRNDLVAVGTSSTEISPARDRTAYHIRNSSDNAADIITIHLGFGTATAEKGIVLKQGQTLTDSDAYNYRCHKGTITAICATANGEISIFESSAQDF